MIKILSRLLWECKDPFAKCDLIKLIENSLVESLANSICLRVACFGFRVVNIMNSFFQIGIDTILEIRFLAGLI